MWYEKRRKYTSKYLKEENKSIKKGLADKPTSPVNLNYEQSQTDKRWTLLHLGSNDRERIPQPQVSPSTPTTTMPQKSEKVKQNPKIFTGHNVWLLKDRLKLTPLLE